MQEEKKKSLIRDEHLKDLPRVRYHPDPLETGVFEDVEEYLVKDGSLCGYLFKCLHCGKYHLWVDAD